MKLAERFYEQAPELFQSRSFTSRAYVDSINLQDFGLDTDLGAGQFQAGSQEIKGASKGDYLTGILTLNDEIVWRCGHLHVTGSFNKRFQPDVESRPKDQVRVICMSAKNCAKAAKEQLRWSTDGRANMSYDDYSDALFGISGAWGMVEVLDMNLIVELCDATDVKEIDTRQRGPVAEADATWVNDRINGLSDDEWKKELRKFAVNFPTLWTSITAELGDEKAKKEMATRYRVDPIATNEGRKFNIIDSATGLSHGEPFVHRGDAFRKAYELNKKG